MAQSPSNGWLRERREEVVTLARLFAPAQKWEGKPKTGSKSRPLPWESGEVVKSKNNELWKWATDWHNRSMWMCLSWACRLNLEVLLEMLPKPSICWRAQGPLTLVAQRSQNSRFNGPSASAKSPEQTQIPKKARDEWGACGGQTGQRLQLLCPLLLSLECRMKSEGSLGGGVWDVCQPWGLASFLIILVQHVQKANWGFFSLFFVPEGVLWLKPAAPGAGPRSADAWEAEGLEPEGRAGAFSILWSRVPWAVTKAGVNLCSTVLAVQHDHTCVCRWMAISISFSLLSGVFQGSNIRVGSVHQAADTLPDHILFYPRKNYFCII